MRLGAAMVLVLAIGLGLQGRGQAQTPVVNTPDCQQFFVLTGVANSGNVDNRQIGCDYWVVAYTNTGFAAVSLVVQSAPDNAGVPGAWVTFAGTVLSGVNPNTSITQAQSTLSGYYPWARMRLDSVTGTGTVRGVLYGWKNRPAGDVTISGLVTVEGPAADGTAPVGDPVLIAGTDNTNVRTLRTGAQGVLSGGISGSGADGVVNTTTIFPQSPGGNSSGTAYAIRPWVFNGATWDRQRGTVTGTWIEGPYRSFTDGVATPDDLRPVVIGGYQTVPGPTTFAVAIGVDGQENGLTVVQRATSNATIDPVQDLYTSGNNPRTPVSLDNLGNEYVLNQPAIGYHRVSDPTGLGIGSVFSQMYGCSRFAAITASAAGNTQIIAGVATARIRICHLSLSAASAVGVAFQYGGGANCSVGPIALTGVYQALGAGVPLTLDFGHASQVILPASAALCVNLSGAVAVGGFVTYSQAN